MLFRSQEAARAEGKAKDPRGRGEPRPPPQTNGKGGRRRRGGGGEGGPERRARPRADRPRPAERGTKRSGAEPARRAGTRAEAPDGQSGPRRQRGEAERQRAAGRREAGRGRTRPSTPPKPRAQPREGRARGGRAGPPADRRAGGAGPGTPTSADEKSASGGAVFPSLRDLLDTMRLTVAGGGGSLSPYPSKFGC